MKNISNDVILSNTRKWGDLMDDRTKYLIVLGGKVKQLRIALDMSQDDLAYKCGYKTRSSIAKIETGAAGIPFDKIPLFAKALRVAPEELRDIYSTFTDYSLSDFESVVLSYLRELNEQGQGKVLEYIKDLVETGRYSEKIINLQWFQVKKG